MRCVSGLFLIFAILLTGGCRSKRRYASYDIGGASSGSSASSYPGDSQPETSSRSDDDPYGSLARLDEPPAASPDTADLYKEFQTLFDQVYNRLVEQDRKQSEEELRRQQQDYANSGLAVMAIPMPPTFIGYPQVMAAEPRLREINAEIDRRQKAYEQYLSSVNPAGYARMKERIRSENAALAARAMGDLAQLRMMQERMARDAARSRQMLEEMRRHH